MQVVILILIFFAILVVHVGCRVSLIQILRHVVPLVVAVVYSEENEEGCESPAEDEVDEAGQRQAELHFVVELGNHGHLAAEARLM